MKHKLSGFILVVLKLFHFFGARCSSNIQSVRRKEESQRQTDRQTDRYLAEGVCSVTCKAKYRYVMMSGKAAQFISLFLVCSHTVVIPPVTFPNQKKLRPFKPPFLLTLCLITEPTTMVPFSCKMFS